MKIFGALGCRCMPRPVAGAMAIAIALAWLAVLSSSALADERRSGRVVGIDDRARIIVIEEVGPWHARKGVTQITRHTIWVTPSTKIASHIRINAPGRFEDDFLEVPLELTDVARGDFVTIECRRVGGRMVASRIDVAEQVPFAVLP